MTKEFYSVFQSITVDEDGTDCGTKGYLEFVLDETFGETFYMFQNIIDDGKIVPLTSDNIKNYMGKKIKMRSPMYCLNDSICSVCAGRRPYIMGQQNIGLTCGRVSNTLLNKSMKLFHNSKVKLDHVDLDDLLL